MQVGDRVRTKDPRARDAVFNIRKARLKLNSLDLLEMFMRMRLWVVDLHLGGPATLVEAGP